MSPLRFEWHAAKAAANLRKHGVAMAEACTVFDDPLAPRVQIRTTRSVNSVTLRSASQGGAGSLPSFTPTLAAQSGSSVRDAPHRLKGTVMKKARKSSDAMRADYGDLDWSKAVRGKYSAAYSKARPTIVVLRPDKTVTAKAPRRRKKTRP